MSHSSFLMSRRITHFLAVFENGNIHSAAERIGLSQPALSMSLKQLEEELGSPLFQRQARGVMPSEAGQILYRYAISMRQAAQLANEEISALRDGTFAKLRLGAGLAWATIVLAEVLADLQTHFPGISIDVITGIGEQLEQLFLAGDLDAFIASGSMPGLEIPTVKKEFVANLPMLAVADKGNRLARQQQVTPADLITKSWVGFHPDQGHAQFAQQYLALRGLPAPHIARRTNSAAVLADLVKDSDLVAVLISPVAQSVCHAGLVELPLSEPLWDLSTNIYYRDMVEDLETIRVFRESVRRKVDDLREEYRSS